MVAAPGGNASFAAVAVLGSNLIASALFPALLALPQGPDAPGSPAELLLRVVPVCYIICHNLWNAVQLARREPVCPPTVHPAPCER